LENFMQKVPAIITEPAANAVIFCDDCCTSNSEAATPAGVLLKRGAVLLYDPATSNWKPFPNSFEQADVVGALVGILKYDVDSRAVAPATAIPGKGVVVTHNAQYSPAMLVWDAAVDATSKAAAYRAMFNQQLKGVPQPAIS
jgi:hypothetical protein